MRLAAVLLAVSFALHAQPMNLWPGAAPGDTAALPPEKDTTTEKGALIAGRSVIRLGNVSTPTLELFKTQKANAPAMLVFPGGGYSILAMDLEGTEVCAWLNSIGLNAVLVKYRVPAQPGTPRAGAPLQDAQRALAMVRENAVQWGIDPKRIGAMGFSAGAHLTGLLSVSSAPPDFAALIYPGLMIQKGQLAPELAITAQHPATFLAQAQDDGVNVANSVVYYQALTAAKVPAEMHLYPTGGHGYGLRLSQHLVTTWPQRLEAWLRSRGVLSAR